MIYILAEPEYSSSFWCRRRLADLTASLKQRRLEFESISHFDQLGEDCQTLFLLGSDPEWLRRTIFSCNQRNIYPIWICYAAGFAIKGQYSVIRTDIRRSMEQLVKALMASGCKKLGLYGYNPASVVDQDTKEGFLSALGWGQEALVFQNRGNLTQCFQDFLAQGAELDTLICCNNFSAISLVQNLRSQDPRRLEGLKLLSFADTHLVTLYTKYITLIPNHMAQYGKAALTLMDTLEKLPSQSTVSVRLHWDVSALASSGKEPECLPEEPDWEPSLYLRDPAVHALMQMETLLDTMDDIDRIILRGLQNHHSYATIAEHNYISASTAKYRVRKMMERIGLQHRQELLDLLAYSLPAQEAEKEEALP